MANPETVGQRFITLISHLGISKNAFAASLDKTATVIQHLVEERNKPGFDLLCKVFEVYPNVSKDWLLQGTGPMLNTEAAPAVQPAATATPENTVAPAEPASSAVASVTEPVTPQPIATAAAPALVPSSATPVSEPAAQPATSVTPQAVAPEASATAAPVAAAPSEASWQTALYTQQMAHQLALAELRNQHLQEQQRLMQQMMDLMQRQLTR